MIDNSLAFTSDLDIDNSNTDNISNLEIDSEIDLKSDSERSTFADSCELSESELDNSDNLDDSNNLDSSNQVDLEQENLAQDDSNNLNNEQIESGVASPEILVDPATQAMSVVNDNPTISVLWDQAAQEAISSKPFGPTDGAPFSAYVLAAVHTAIYDAWSAYADTPISATTSTDELQRPQAENTEANKIEAVSYAAYQTLVDILPGQSEIFAQLMEDLGLDPNLQSTDPTTAAGIGTLTAIAAWEARSQDGSNYLGNDPNGNGTRFSDNSGYTAVNSPDNVRYIDQFTPENTPVNDGPLLQSTAQTPLSPQFGKVEPFALESGDQFRPQAPEGFLVDGVNAEVDLQAKKIILEDGTSLEISQELVGPIINPQFIAQAEEVVNISANLTDEQKLKAEFWEDGPGSSLPPGNSQTFGQYVSARDNNSLDQDVELFFALGNSQLDAGIAAWDAKYSYNYTRPLRAVRELGKLGLIGEYNQELGGYAIEAYAGSGKGTQTILAEDFITYQFGETESSPPFPEYVSGHSTFSAAGAEVLDRFTGSDRLGASVGFNPGDSRFEKGQTPAEYVSLEWDTFSEFAEESGISRLYGGIHFTPGNLEGGKLGRNVGSAAYAQAQFFINGGIESGSDLIADDNSSGLESGLDTTL